VKHDTPHNGRPWHAGANLRVLASAILLSAGPLGFHVARASRAWGATVEHVRGIYLQRAIEVATVGSRTVHLTRMTRFMRCGRFRGTAEDFNEHLVDAAGREVPGIGFVAGLVSTIEGCARQDGQRDRPRFNGGARRE
jgi:hypothetical protein